MIAMRTGPALALAAAVLFGLSTPAAKVLVSTTDPWLLAGLLYLGSGVGLGAYRLSRLLLGRAMPEPALGGRDLWWLAGAIVFGGLIGPVLLTYGLFITGTVTEGPVATQPTSLGRQAVASYATSGPVTGVPTDLREFELRQPALVVDS